MYRLLVKRKVREGFLQLSRGVAEDVAGGFAPDGLFFFAGDHALQAELRGPEQVRDWFEQAFAAFPGLRFVPLDIVVAGPPWRTVVMSRLEVTATLPGGVPYVNEAFQLLRLRWGKVTEDRVTEDTQKLAAALTDIAARSDDEACILGHEARRCRPIRSSSGTPSRWPTTRSEWQTGSQPGSPANRGGN